MLRICVTVCKFALELELALAIWRSDVANLHHCLQLCVEIELWQLFWRPWVARIQARAPFQSEIRDSYEKISLPRAGRKGTVGDGFG